MVRWLAKSPSGVPISCIDEMSAVTGSGTPKEARQSQPERIRGMIRRQIILPDLRPGQIFIEPDLGREYGVSKTPVRETLQMLTPTALVSVQPRKGCKVRSPSFNHVRVMGVLSHSDRKKTGLHFCCGGQLTAKT